MALITYLKKVGQIVAPLIQSRLTGNNKQAVWLARLP